MTRADTPFAADERTMLLAFLDYQRETMIMKLEGLSDDAARYAPEPPGNSLGGLVRHLAYVERWWFPMCFAGESLPVPWTDDDPNADFRVPPEMSIEELVSFYRETCARSNSLVRAAPSLDELSVIPARGNHRTLRWILVHMIEETARHAGHADITREIIDGSKGI